MNFTRTFIERSRYYLAHEYPTKISRCLDVLPEDALWRRSDPGSNSIGNLLMHLDGNIRQWIVSSVGGAPDHRHRAAEFAATEGGSRQELVARLRSTVDEADAVIGGLSDSELASRRTIQGRDVTVFEAVYHVVEHFALHTGQIILLTKQYSPGQVKFYEDAGGTAKQLY